MPATERTRLIKLIHVARRDLAMDDDTYRQIVASKASGKTSSADCTITELERIIAHLKQAGFKVRKPKAAKPAEARPLDTSREASKLRALWLLLHHIGAVRDPSESALAAYAKRTTGIDALQWAKPQHYYKLIEGLKAWAARELPAAIETRLAARVAAGQLPAHCNLARVLTWSAPTLNPTSFDALHSAWKRLSLLETIQGDTHVADAR